MRFITRLLVATSLLALPAAPLLAQTAADPTGHWEGALSAPSMTVDFEVDLAKTVRGEIAGSINVPQQQLKGLPLLKVAVDGRAVTFQARSDQPFNGTLSTDGKSLAGNMSINGAAVPFALTRTGDARLAKPATSARVSKTLEGTWNGVLSAGGPELHLVLTLANQPDGTATGQIVNTDEGGLRIPVAITQRDASVTLESTVVVSSFSGTLNSSGTELSGTFTQGPLSVPLTFMRAAQ